MSRWTPGREGPEMEWKERLPRAERLARTLSAFANGRGGILLVGVTDSGEVIGVDDLAAVRSEVRRVAKELVEPPVRLATRRRNIDGCVILEARVQAEDESLVHVVLPDGRRVAYVRDGSSSRPAGRKELQALEKGTRGLVRLDPQAVRVLEAIEHGDAATAGSVARAARVGVRTARRIVVRLMQAGLVLEKDHGRLWLTPDGHDRLARKRGGKR